MKLRVWILAGLGLGLAAYIVLSRRGSHDTAETDGVESAGDRVGFWGRKQRVAGAGKYAAGKLKEGIGKVVGDDTLVAEGVVDQVEGAMQHTAGEAASSVGKVIHDLNG